MSTLSKSASPLSKFSNNKSDIRIILLGKTGEGKSELGNFLLGRPEFKTGSYAASMTVESARAWTTFNDRKLIIVDTPGLFDTTLSNEKISHELTHTYYDVTPGPHAFLIVATGRHTTEAEKTLTLLIRLFGEQVIPYCIVIISHEDDMQEDDITLDQYLGNTESPLRIFVNKCGNRCIAVNSKTNNSEERKKKLTELIQYVDEISRSNITDYFTHEKFQQAEIDEARRKQLEEQKRLKDLGEDEIRRQENCELQQREKATENKKQIHERSLQTIRETRDVERQQRGNGGAGGGEVFVALAYVTLQVVCAVLNGNDQQNDYLLYNSRRSTTFNHRVHFNNDCHPS